MTTLTDLSLHLSFCLCFLGDNLQFSRYYHRFCRFNKNVCIQLTQIVHHINTHPPKYIKSSKCGFITKPKIPVMVDKINFDIAAMSQLHELLVFWSMNPDMQWNSVNEKIVQMECLKLQLPRMQTFILLWWKTFLANYYVLFGKIHLK